MILARTNESINKAEDARKMDTQIGFVDALQRVFPTAVTSSHFVAEHARRPCETEFRKHF